VGSVVLSIAVGVFVGIVAFSVAGRGGLWWSVLAGDGECGCQYSRWWDGANCGGQFRRCSRVL